MECPMCKKQHESSIQEAIKLLAVTPKCMARLALDAGAKSFSKKPAPDKWSAKEILCHLADCEVVYGMRYRKILAEPGSTLTAFNQDAWAERLDYKNQAFTHALAAFSALRNGHLALLKSLPEDAWNRNGIHPEYGALELRQIVVHLVEHDRKHIDQAQRACAASLAKAKKKSAKKGSQKPQKKTKKTN